MLTAANTHSLLPGNRPAVLGPADNQFRREPSVPELQAGLQRALQGPGAAAAGVAGHAGQAELAHVTPLPGPPRPPAVTQCSQTVAPVSPLLQTTRSQPVLV